jgi:L-ascorbate metabolism protein UlaG (beta-lactamase superfamily)
MKINFWGHSCFSVEIDGLTLLFDPFITSNEKASAIRLTDVKADFILISHGHSDHIDDAVALARQNDATVVSNWEIITWISKQGITKTHPMNIGGKWKFPFGTVKMTNAIHSSSLPDGTYAGNPAGFVIESGAGNFYYAGDTALTMDMKIIGEQHKLSFALLPLGDNFTMGVDDAVTAAEWVKAGSVIGLHYDTFGYIMIDHEAARQKFRAKGIELHLPEIGSSIHL